MKLSARALSKVNTPAVRHELSGMLKCTEQTIIRYIHKNEENGPLTTIGVLNAVKALTQLSYEEMLEGGSINA
jgi:hypothetical protein